MKKDVHPKYYETATMQCVCGNTITVGSTVAHLEVEICSKCHPFYTGRDQLIDTAGRVERFRARKEKVKMPSVKRPRTKKTAHGK